MTQLAIDGFRFSTDQGIVVFLSPEAGFYIHTGPECQGNGYGEEVA